MNFSKTIKRFSLVCLTLLVLAVLTGCPKKKKEKYNNETDPLIFSSQEADKVFNPFFHTSAADSQIVGMTQLGMIGNDKEGKPTYGDDEAVIVKDLEITTTGTEDEEDTNQKSNEHMDVYKKIELRFKSKLEKSLNKLRCFASSNGCVGDSILYTGRATPASLSHIKLSS